MEETTYAAERLNKRIHVALPVRITHWDNDNRPALRMACTYDISPRGARISGLSGVKNGEIVALERGRTGKIYCRVAWVGEQSSELTGQVGIECVEAGRDLWESELREMDESFDLLQFEKKLSRSTFENFSQESRRRQPRFDVKGVAELLRASTNTREGQGGISNLSEMGCLVQTSHTLAMGAQLKLVLQLANYDLTVKGEVRHTAPEMGMGIEFSEIRKGDRQVLSFLLRKLAEQQFEEAFQLEV